MTSELSNSDYQIVKNAPENILQEKNKNPFS